MFLNTLPLLHSLANTEEMNVTHLTSGNHLGIPNASSTLLTSLYCKKQVSSFLSSLQRWGFEFVFFYLVSCVLIF